MSGIFIFGIPMAEWIINIPVIMGKFIFTQCAMFSLKLFKRLTSMRLYMSKRELSLVLTKTKSIFVNLERDVKKLVKIWV